MFKISRVRGSEGKKSVYDRIVDIKSLNKKKEEDKISLEATLSIIKVLFVK